MGCNCSKPRPRPRRTVSQEKFMLIDGAGNRQVFGSRLEAEAEFIRRGRRGVIRPT